MPSNFSPPTVYYDESTVAPKEDNKKYTVSKHGWPVCVNADSLSVCVVMAWNIERTSQQWPGDTYMILIHEESGSFVLLQ